MATLQTTDVLKLMGYDAAGDGLAGFTRNVPSAELLAFPARYRSDAGQSIAHNTITVVNFEDVVFDPYVRVTTGAAWKYTAFAPGVYHISAAVLFAATTGWTPGTEESRLLLYRNGSEWSTLDYASYYNTAAATQAARLGGSDDVEIAANDYLDIRVLQTSGAALAFHTNPSFMRVAIHKLPG